ncbi:hypothetical protein, partial [Kamptonema sp. UHCC 0994]|uniref:hypothetical protein n=1 Tax=Kamptonema sp. UHCC 0994 TaxID=3031329 RepID=UPI0031BA55EA
MKENQNDKDCLETMSNEDEDKAAVEPLSAEQLADFMEGLAFWLWSDLPEAEKRLFRTYYAKILGKCQLIKALISKLLKFLNPNPQRFNNFNLLL